MNNPIPSEYMVRVECMTYNHAPYIEDAMNGFCMQETNFPFVCVIVDDASTDGEPEVIKKYLKNNFDLQDSQCFREEDTDDYHLIFARHKTNLNCYFGVLLLKYNHWGKKDKAPYYESWSEAKYIALCEGDDYWTHSKKLQIQAFFLNNHSDYSMCWHDALKISAKDKTIKGNHQYCYGNTTCKIEKLIEGMGGFCPTASMLYRDSIIKNAPQDLLKQYVGDYTIQLLCALSGKVYYFDNQMSVYRIDVSGSWSSIISENYQSQMKRLWYGEKKLLDDFNKYSYYKYHHSFKQAEYKYLFYELWKIGDYHLSRRYWHKIDLNKRPWSFKYTYMMQVFSTIKSFIDNIRIRIAIKQRLGLYNGNRTC